MSTCTTSRPTHWTNCGFMFAPRHGVYVVAQDSSGGSRSTPGCCNFFMLGSIGDRTMRTLFKSVGKPTCVVLMAILLMMLLDGAAMAAFQNDYPLTYNTLPVNISGMNQRMAWNPVTGKIGLAYVETNSAAAS